jgi:integrase
LSRVLKACSINPIVGALRFFYGTTLGNKALADQIGYARPEDTLSAVLTQDQVVLALIKAEPDRMMRTIFITIYAAALRISEVIRLSTGDINNSCFARFAMTSSRRTRLSSSSLSAANRLRALSPLFLLIMVGFLLALTLAALAYATSSGVITACAGKSGGDVYLVGPNFARSTCRKGD